MKKIAALTLTMLTLAACNTTTVEETKDGTQAPAPTTQISAQVLLSTPEIHATVGTKTYQATITPQEDPAALYANFSLPLPSSMTDDQLTRFTDLFSPGACKQSVTGNYYARLHVLSTLQSGTENFTAVSTVLTGNIVTSTLQTMYLYSDRDTYLRGTVSCPNTISGNTKQVTGFELNLMTGWNRVVLNTTTGQNPVYATTATITDSTELWKRR